LLLLAIEDKYKDLKVFWFWQKKFSDLGSIFCNTNECYAISPMMQSKVPQNAKNKNNNIFQI
jgi:hypothetical protein